MDIDYTVGEVELSYKPKFKKLHKVVSSEDAYRYLLPTYKEGTICYKEYFKVLFLNQSGQILGYTLISEGGITETCADVRVILQAALLTNSVTIILAHNHPSGSMKPSRLCYRFAVHRAIGRPLPAEKDYPDKLYLVDILAHRHRCGPRHLHHMGSFAHHRNLLHDTADLRADSFPVFPSGE